MIERYSRPQMKKIWSEENKFDKWLQVEIAVCEAWAEMGTIPKEAIPKIKTACCNLERIGEILKVTHHDMTAFLQAVAEGLGEESRFIHLGLTSSDIIDTALSLQLKEATKLLAQDIDELIAVLQDKACAKLRLVPAPISSQIIQRDRHAQFVTTLAIIASSLEKFATEIRSLQRTEVLEAEEPFAPGQTGSSAMPHKRNPELCERVCGLARLVRGYALTSMENITLWHERDISHSSNERITLPDSCLVLDYILHIFTSVMRGLQVYPENMRRNLEITQGLVFSQRVLIALINKGLSRQEAYKLVQRK